MVEDIPSSYTVGWAHAQIMLLVLQLAHGRCEGAFLHPQLVFGLRSMKWDRCICAGSCGFPLASWVEMWSNFGGEFFFEFIQLIWIKQSEPLMETHSSRSHPD